MKITMYELLGLVKDGKAPRKIKYKGSIYTYLEQEGNKIYQYEDYNAVLDIQCFEKLNEEVEIIKEVKEYIGISEEDRKLYDIYDVNGIEILEILDKENKDE